MLWDKTKNQFIEVPYGVEAAATPAGPVANIPHISLQPDHAETLPNRAMIEHVAGPRQLTDTTYATQLRIACETFIKTFKDANNFVPKIRKASHHVTPLQNVLDKYNNKLPNNPVYANFKLTATVSNRYDWYVKPARDIHPATQLNFEVPFRNLGRLPEEGEKNDFALAFKIPEYKKMFQACRQCAKELVNSTFRPIANLQLQAGGRTLADPDSIKLEKLKSLFTLYYYLRVVEQYKGRLDPGKDAYELLPKAPVNDLIRTALSNRDRAVLIAVTGNNAAFPALKTQMNADILACVQKVSIGKRQLTEPAVVNQLHDGIFRPGAGGRYQGEGLAAYGTALDANPPAHNSFANKPDSPSGKPLQAQGYAYDKNGTSKIEPTVVFESRHSDHPFSKLGCACMLDRLARQQKMLALTQAKQALLNAQKPFVNRAPKN
jgi:hypothetical protein